MRQRILFHVGEQQGGPAPTLGCSAAPYDSELGRSNFFASGAGHNGRRGSRRRSLEDVAGGEKPLRVVVEVQGQADLVQVVLAAGLVRRLTDFLHRGQQQADEHADDGDDHQQLNQGEPLAGPHGSLLAADRAGRTEPRLAPQKSLPLTTLPSSLK